MNLHFHVCGSNNSMVMLLSASLWYVDEYFQKSLKQKRETDVEGKKESEGDEKKQMKPIRVARCLKEFQHTVPAVSLFKDLVSCIATN